MSAVAAPASPFKGLAPFGDSDADALLFFGRVHETEVIAANLQASRLTVLYGPSGVGKSSVLRAGVAHRLRAEPDVAVEILDAWAGDAAGAVRDALELRPESGDLYLILDQFEEYFVYHADDFELPRLLGEVIGERGLRVNVLLGIRDDALARLDAFRAPVPNLLANRLRLERLDRAAARDAIVGPVARYNELTGESVEVEPELVAAVLDEVAAGRLDLARGGRGSVDVPMQGDRIEAPYLQLVLERLWEAEREQGSGRLRAGTLRELGGATRIVHEHLERAMAGLSEEEQETAAQMYHHLVTPGGTKIGHRVGDLAGYAAVPERDAAAVLDKLTRERIVRASTDDGPASTRYEIYHDVLADAVLAWRARHEESRALRRAEERRRRAHVVAAAALVGLIVVAGIAVFALVERGHARTQARHAHAQQLAAQAITQLDVDPGESVRLALAAAQLQHGPHEEEVLRNALTRDRERAVLRGRGPVNVALFDPSGARILAAGKDGQARTYDRRGRLLATYDHGASIDAAAFAPMGGLLATGGRDGIVKLWRGAATQPLATLAAGGTDRFVGWDARGRHVYTVTANGIVRAWRVARRHSLVAEIRTRVRTLSAVVAPSGRYAVLVAHDRFARVFSLLTHRRVARLAQKGYIGNVAFSPGERLVLTTGNEGTVRLWHVGSWRFLRELRGPDSAVPEAVFSRDGSLVSAAGNDGTVRVWETATGFQRSVMIGHTNEVTSVAFNPDATAVVSTSTDGTARVWDIGGRATSILAGHRNPVRSAMFSSDGSLVVTVGDDGTARLWDPGSEPELEPVGHRRVVDLAASADGRRFVTAGDGLVLWNAQPLRRLRILLRQPTELAAISPDGSRLAAALRSPRGVVLFDSRGRTLSRIRAGHAVTAVAVDSHGRLFAAAGASIVRWDDGRVTRLREVASVDGVAVSPDGAVAATAGADGAVRLRDPKTWKLIRTLRGDTDDVSSVDFGPDGNQLVTSSRDHDVRIWDVASGRVVRTLHWHFGPVADAAISNDGRWLVTAGPGTAGIGLVARAELFRPGAYLRGPTRPLTAVAFAGAKDRRIVAAAKDGKLRVFNCSVCGDVDELIALARARLAGRR